MTAQKDTEARSILDDPMWREKPATETEKMTLPITLDGEQCGEVTIAAGYIKDRGEYGWTRIRELTIKPCVPAVEGSAVKVAMELEKMATELDANGDVEPQLDRAVRQARNTLRDWEATRRFVNDVLDDVGPEKLLVLRSGDDKLRPSEERELAARVHNMAMEAGQRNPVVWVAEVLGVGYRTASRRLTEAEAQGLTTRPQKQTREITKKARAKRGKK